MGDLSPHFGRWEFACRCGCGYDTVDAELLQVLQELRNWYQRPITITSGARCVAHNSDVGGAINSQHIHGKAADIVVGGVYEGTVADHLESMYDDRYGIGRYKGRTHIDVRPVKARWSKPGVG